MSRTGLQPQWSHRSFLLRFHGPPDLLWPPVPPTTAIERRSQVSPCLSRKPSHQSPWKRCVLTIYFGSPAFVFLSAQLLETFFCPHHKSCLILAQNLRAPSVEVGSKPAFRLLTGPLPCGSPQPSYQPAVRSQFCGLAVVHVMRSELDRGTKE